MDLSMLLIGILVGAVFGFVFGRGIEQEGLTKREVAANKRENAADDRDTVLRQKEHDVGAENTRQARAANRKATATKSTRSKKKA